MKATVKTTKIYTLELDEEEMFHLWHSLNMAGSYRLGYCNNKYLDYFVHSKAVTDMWEAVHVIYNPGK